MLLVRCGVLRGSFGGASLSIVSKLHCTVHVFLHGANPVLRPSQMIVLDAASSRNDASKDGRNGAAMETDPQMHGNAWGHLHHLHYT
jgi:hypothetical protein